MARRFTTAVLLLLFSIVIGSAVPVAAKLRDGECTVCIKTLGHVVEAMGTDTTTVAAERELKKYCKTATGKENRFCYYIGATEDAASTIIKDVATPLSNGVPPNLVCERLKKRDPQICELTYDAEIDWKTVDLNKLRVKDLKKITTDIKAPCQGCSEKSEFIRIINEARTKAGVKIEL